jgi:hypothetical protein
MSLSLAARSRFKEVENLRRGLRDMEPLRITRMYQEAWQACRMAVHELPPPEALQVMVQAWKEFWRRRRR